MKERKKLSSCIGTYKRGKNPSLSLFLLKDIYYYNNKYKRERRERMLLSNIA